MVLMMQLVVQIGANGQHLANDGANFANWCKWCTLCKWWSKWCKLVHNGAPLVHHFLNNNAPNYTLVKIVGAGLFNYMNVYQYVKYIDGPFQWLRHAFESGGGP